MRRDQAHLKKHLLSFSFVKASQKESFHGPHLYRGPSFRCYIAHAIQKARLSATSTVEKVNRSRWRAFHRVLHSLVPDGSFSFPSRLVFGGLDGPGSCGGPLGPKGCGSSVQLCKLYQLTDGWKHTTF